jgi:peptidoglycan/LPS O-acetylase OafA/YrhL
VNDFSFFQIKMLKTLTKPLHFLASNIKFPVPWAQQEGENTKWNFLNGYRGFLALYVILAHSPDRNKSEIVDFAVHSARVIALFGFFVMSAFLLTYRLIKDLESAAKSSSTAVWIVLFKYTIRRFFRIYVVVILFIFILKYTGIRLGGSTFLDTDSVFSILTLERPSVYAFQLWTIPVEIKYYFIVPIICLVCLFFRRTLNTLFVPFILGCTLAAINEFYNICNVAKEDLYYYDYFATGQLRIRFFVFFYGSLAAMALLLIESNQTLMKIIKTKWMQNALVITLFSVIFYVFRFRTQYFYIPIEDTFSYETIPSLAWGVCIVIMVLSHPNSLTNYLAASNVLVSSGKYSFGIYLWHIVVIEFYRDRVNSMTNNSEVVDVGGTIVISYFVGYLFYCVVEEPLIVFANYLCKRMELAILTRFGRHVAQLSA